MIIGRNIAPSLAVINSIINQKLIKVINQIFSIVKIIIKALNRKGILSKKDNKEIKKIYKKIIKIRKDNLKAAKGRKKAIKDVSKRIERIKKMSGNFDSVGNN